MAAMVEDSQGTTTKRDSELIHMPEFWKVYVAVGTQVLWIVYSLQDGPDLFNFGSGIFSWPAYQHCHLYTCSIIWYTPVYEKKKQLLATTIHRWSEVHGYGLYMSVVMSSISGSTVDCSCTTDWPRRSSSGTTLYNYNLPCYLKCSTSLLTLHRRHCATTMYSTIDY